MNTVKCKQCGATADLEDMLPEAPAPHVCASVRVRDAVEVSLELFRAKVDEASAKGRVQRLEVELRRAEEAAAIEVAEQRGREWLSWLQRCLQPGARYKAFLKNLDDRCNWDGRGSNAYDQSEFTYVLPSGHEVKLTVKPGRERPPTE